MRVQEFTLNCTNIPPRCCDTSLIRKRAYILGYVDSLNWNWLGANFALRLQRAIMSRAASNVQRGLLLAIAAAVVGLSLTNAARADRVLVGGTSESAFIDLGDQGFDAFGLQKGNGSAVFKLTAATQAALKGSGSSGFLAGLSPTLGCEAGAACGPPDAGPDSFLELARSAVATPLAGAIFLFGSVLIGGLGLSARRARRRNRGAVSLLA